MTEQKATNVTWHAHAVSKEERCKLNGHKGAVLWFTGLSACGKSTIANEVDHKLHQRGKHTFVLDGDNIRMGLNKNLGFTAEDRTENIRRIGEVAKLFAQLAGFSRLHLAQARKRATAVDPSKQIPPDYAWPDNETPERTALGAGDPSMSRLDALRAARVGERRGYEFYFTIAEKSKDPEISAAAKEFYQEEAEHVQVLEAWITREEWLQKNPLPTTNGIGR